MENLEMTDMVCNQSPLSFLLSNQSQMELNKTSHPTRFFLSSILLLLPALPLSRVIQCGLILIFLLLFTQSTNPILFYHPLSLTPRLLLHYPLLIFVFLSALSSQSSLAALIFRYFL